MDHIGVRICHKVTAVTEVAHCCNCCTVRVQGGSSADSNFSNCNYSVWCLTVKLNFNLATAGLPARGSPTLHSATSIVLYYCYSCHDSSAIFISYEGETFITKWKPIPFYQYHLHSIWNIWLVGYYVDSKLKINVETRAVKIFTSWGSNKYIP